ncbi:unnamed protein product [Hydatigera taeniaeformis]|uniref:ZM domain-containing protein n=1 Tax=Hydatigena taeniaeformis TaxID=6205 RepID=A0A0R3X0W4_HYDTA|nr:unnamed protein product [Hydatigera taeniaeformis]
MTTVAARRPYTPHLQQAHPMDYRPYKTLSPPTCHALADPRHGRSEQVEFSKKLFSVPHHNNRKQNNTYQMQTNPIPSPPNHLLSILQASDKVKGQSHNLLLAAQA